MVTGTAELTDQRLVGVGLIGANRPLLLGGSPEADRRPHVPAAVRPHARLVRDAGRTGDRRGRRRSSTSAHSAHCPMRPAWRGMVRCRSSGRPQAVAAGRGPGRRLGRPVLRARRWGRRAAARLVPGGGRLAPPAPAAGRCAASPARRECGADHRRHAVAGGPVGAPRRAGGHRRRCGGGRAPGDGLRRVGRDGCGRVRRGVRAAGAGRVGGARCRRRHRGCALAGHRCGRRPVRHGVRSGDLGTAPLPGAQRGSRKSADRNVSRVRRCVIAGSAADAGGRRVSGGRRIVDRLALALPGHDRPPRPSRAHGDLQHADHRSAPSSAAHGHGRVLGGCRAVCSSSPPATGRACDSPERTRRPSASPSTSP